MRLLQSIMKGDYALIITLLLLFATVETRAQEPFNNTPIPRLNDLLPLDESVVKGKLGNGLTYYVRQNFKPENRAQVWLVVNAGSILEDEDQLGLAHFVEHMAFNGTEDFAEQEIIDYLESIGMKFGPEINAYTGFDETVYMLQLPTDSLVQFEKGFEILRQWADKISFDSVEIEKERGVIIEEWRLGQGAGMRMLDEQLPVILKGSRYVDRLPIGTLASLENFNHKSLVRFYEEWYRPDLMAVIAVGDFDVDHVEELIQRNFRGLTGAGTPRERVEFPIPDHEETLFTIATDPETTNTGISVYFKSDVLPEEKVSDYRRMLIEQLFTRMLNIRLYELLNQAEPPYLYSYISRSGLARTKTLRSLNVAVRENGIEMGIETALTETFRVQRHGFTESELERTKTWLLRRIEKSNEERDKTESRAYASEYLRNFLEQEPVPGIGYEYLISRSLLPGITLDEVNALSEKWLAQRNRVITLNAPEKDDLVLPDEDLLASLFSGVEESVINPYVDLTDDEPLLEDLTTNADIVAESSIEELGMSTWKLSNGITVHLKPTDFKNDQILFQAYSPGGNSLVPDEQFRSSRAATDIIALSGLGKNDLNSLNKKLTGKIATVFPYINELSEGFTGSCSPRDMETMFRLIYLYAMYPRQDSSAYLSFKTRMQGVIENRSGDPESAYYDTLMVTLANYHFRKRPWSMEMLDEINPQDSYRIYTDRFSDFGDYVFVFVGSFEPDSIKPFITTYLGSLPSTGRMETWKDINLRAPKGVIKKTVEKGIESKSRVSLNITGDYEWNRENNYALSSMTSVLRIKLREILREDLSGTYGTSVGSRTSLYPNQKYGISISFGCEPGRTDELIDTVFSIIDSLKMYPVDPIYIQKVTETQRRSHESSLERNRFWLSSLINYFFSGRDPRLLIRYPELFETLNPAVVQEAARKYLDTRNLVQIVLLPEETDVKNAGQE